MELFETTPNTFDEGWTIYYDDVQEGCWFSHLHPALADANLVPITGALKTNHRLQGVLVHDRPDVILTHDRHPVVVVERTEEVPSGHNVGQRFARLAAAAEAGAPLVYVGPYVARKHGGKTEGPRWMNLRLFRALDILADIHGASITTIDWPVDENYGLIKDPSKDDRIREYLDLVLAALPTVGVAGLNKLVAGSEFQARQLKERDTFETTVRAAQRYESPPPSVRILPGVLAAHRLGRRALAEHDEVVLYKIGMRYMRSDPYTGSAMLYRYLYVLGERERNRALILHFPYITQSMWDDAIRASRRKDVRLFSAVADGIVFADGYR